MEHGLLVVMVAGLGGLVGRRLGAPGGTLLGAAGATLVLSLVDSRGTASVSGALPLIQILAGTMLGLSIDRGVGGIARRHAGLIAATAGVTAAVWATTGVVVAAAGLLEPDGALLGSAPAGPAISLLVGDQLAPAGVVGLLLVLRVVAVSGVLAGMLRRRARGPRLAPVQRRAQG